MRRLLAWSILLLPALVGAQGFDLSIRNIMRGPEVYGREPTNVRWTPDGQWIYFNWLPAGTDFREQLKPYRVRAVAGAKPEVLTDAQMDSVGPLVVTGSVSPDRMRRVLEYRGDLFVTDLRRSATRPLTQTLATESAPRWSADGQKVLFIRENNSFSIDLSTGFERQLTDIRTADAGNAPAVAARGPGARVPVGGATGTPPRGDTQRGALERDQRDLLAATSGAVKSIDVLTDTAWVGGPCGFGCAGFANDDQRVYWVGEATGYAQLWSASIDGSDKQQLTSGNFEIYDVRLSNDRRTFLFHSSETSAFNRDLWSMAVMGGARTKLTPDAGGHQVMLSPDEQSMADVWSRTNRPPELYLVKRGANVMPSPLTTSPTGEFLSYGWKNPEIVMIPASDGVKVPAHIYRPADFGATPNGAAVIFVHGAGYMHNIHHYWKSSYPREYIFNHFLATKGYVVLDIDYRGSAGHGRDWRTAIYRFMGGRDLQDQVDGSKYLASTFGVNPERIGMYGGSYGGCMTLMALFTEPKHFGAGAALRSVTDWAHYNHQYTGQILNLPQDDSVAYHRSSPIFHAEGLEDPLLMLHGMVDQNVNFQDIVRLNERLIELGKINWDLAVFPVEDHGFVRPASWTDEYRRIFDLFERTIGPTGSKVAAPR